MILGRCAARCPQNEACSAPDRPWTTPRLGIDGNKVVATLSPMHPPGMTRESQKFDG